jgi:hypothetical protein
MILKRSLGAFASGAKLGYAGFISAIRGSRGGVDSDLACHFTS